MQLVFNLIAAIYKRYTIQKGQSKMDNPEKELHKTNKNKKHNTICVGHHYTQTNPNNVNKTRALLKQLEVKTNRTSFFMRKS